jgi:hypothetical protein
VTDRDPLRNKACFIVGAIDRLTDPDAPTPFTAEERLAMVRERNDQLRAALGLAVSA